MVYCLFNLNVHRFFHLPLSISTVAVKRHYQGNDGNYTNEEDGGSRVASIINIVNTSFKIIFEVIVIKNWLADLRCVFKSSAECVQNSLCLHLPSISSIINDNWWNNVTTILVPIGDFFFNDRVLVSFLDPVFSICRTEAFIYALHSIVPFKMLYIAMLCFRAFFGDCGSTFRVDTSNISPKLSACLVISWVSMFMNAFLSDVLHNDFLSRELVLDIKWAILASSKAMLVDPFLFTFLALPINEVGAHHNFVSKFIIKLTKVLDEIKNIIVVTGVPNIVFHSIIWPPQVELNENRNLLLGFGSWSLHKIKEL